MQKQNTVSGKKSFLKQRKRLASSLIEENKVKRHKQSCGAPSLLDCDDESLAKAIEDKSTAHGQRHDMVLYTNHRVKKKDFLSLANYFR